MSGDYKDRMASWVDDHVFEGSDGQWWAQGLDGALLCAQPFGSEDELADWLWSYIIDNADLIYSGIEP